MHTYGLTPDGEQIVLQKFKGGVATSPSVVSDREHSFLVLDEETTGLTAGRDKIIELAAALVDVNVDSGAVVRHHGTVSWLEDPGISIPPEIVTLTGITDDAVRGQAIPEEAARALFASARLVITHNASFDRAFCVARFPWLTGRGMPMWACSLKEVEWRAYGHRHADLESLARDHGFFYDAHRATIDVEALVKLLAMAHEPGGRPYVCDIIEDVRKTYFLVAAAGTPFEAKDELKLRGYTWDAENKFWFRSLPEDTMQAEVGWIGDLCRKYGRGRPMEADLPRRARFDGAFKPEWKERSP
jgi:DNA polymerase-3 subunit epsilon